MTQLSTTTHDRTDAIESALILGDLSKLTQAERLEYYRKVCESLGLNPLTKPFSYILLSGKLTLYALKDCTEQLRTKRVVSITKLEREIVEGVYVVTAYALDKDGRTDVAIGAVAIEGLKGEARANAMMKAETKAKRRVTLSICGLGMLDENEVEDIPGGQIIAYDETTTKPVSQRNRNLVSALVTTRDMLADENKGITKESSDAIKGAFKTSVQTLVNDTNAQLRARELPELGLGKSATVADAFRAASQAIDAMQKRDEDAPVEAEPEVAA